MKKAVFVSSILPFPVDAAKKVTVSGIMKYLCERYGVEHVAYVLIGELDSGESLERSTPYKLLALGKPGVTRQIWNVLWFSLTRRTKSIQESMLYSAGLKTQLLNAIRNLGPAIVICDTLRVGQFLETPQRPAARYVLHLDDLLSIRYQKMEKDLTRFPEARLNPLGDFSKFVPTLFQSLIKMRYIQKWVLRLEQRLVEKREENCVKWFDTNLLVSKEETSLLRSKTKDAPIRTIKPLLQNPRKAMTRDYDGEPTFVFLGRLDYPPNRLSIVNFITTQMDRVIEKIPECRLRVIGKGGDSELLKLAEKYRGAIRLEGFVDDLDSVFSKACAMIIPLLSGSGIKLKTLEAFSRGIPVISTDSGVEGIEVTNTVNCIVENDINRYPDIMLSLLNINYNSNISQKARDLYLRQYSEEVLFQEYDQYFWSYTTSI